MKGSEARKRIYKSLCASFLAFVMIFTNVLGAVEVYAADGIEAPTITKAFIGTNTISGGNLHRGKINGKNARGTVHVTLKDSSGNEKATVFVTPKSGTTWTVNLPEGVTIAEGDTVTAYQEFNGSNSEPVTVNAMDSLAIQNKDKLKMPQGEIWIEQTSSNQVNDDEQAEAVEMFNNANTAIAGDIKSVKFSIDTAAHAYYEVTYTDGSTSGKVEATNLQIKQVTEHSRGATLGSITIVDNVIKGKLAGEGPFDGIKVQILLKLSDAVKDSYCDGGKCLVDKDTSDPVDATVNGETGEFTYTIPNPDLKLDQKVGVTVKEPHKFKSCSQTTVKPVKVDKIEVKDPRKLTADDKKAIDAAIRKGYTVNGESKLPNGTGDWDGVPAVIQIDDSGNVKIFSGNDVAGTWPLENDYKFVPEKNADGSYKVKDGAEPKITIPAKDLLKNLKPDAPKVDLSGDKKSITITPNEKDTDANSISVSYTGKDGKTKTTTATKDKNETWSITEGEGSVDKNGVVTIPKDKVKGGTDVTATVTDKGGIADDDTTPLTSEQGSLTVEETKADKVEALGGLDPKDIKKWVGDDVNWKDGIKAKESTKETEVNKLLEGATFEDATDTARKTDSAGTRAGKIKVKFDDNSELVVDNQTLYVSNHVTNKDAQNLPDDALEVEFQLGEGTKVNNVGSGAVEGNKDTPTLYQKYKVKPNTNLKDYKLPTINQSVVDSIKLSAQEGYVEPVWNTEDFTATKTNKTFTATATKAYNVTLEANGGDGNMAGAQVKENGTYKLPDNAFTPPNENQEFAGWLVNGATTVTKPGTDITITKDTVIKASWKPIELKAKFLPGEGATGSMEEKTVTKGSEFELPTPTFTAPKDKVFAGWQVNNEDGVKQAKDKIKISGDVTLTATWKDIEYKVTFNGTEGTGTMPEKLVKKGEEYTLPDNGFEAPKDKVFDGWMVGTDKKSAGDTITVNGDTEVKAVWKDIEYKVTFNGTEGTGTMPEKLVIKGEEYTLPDNGFEAPKDKVFDGWMVGTDKKSAGDAITINGDTEVKAVWKAKPVVPTPNPGGGEEPSPNPNPEQPQTIAAPKVTVDTKTGNLIITPPVGKDIKSVTVNYQDPTGADKKLVAEKSSDGWSLVPAATNGEKVDSNSGVITIPRGKYKLEEAVKAFANNQVNQKSDEANATPVEVSYDVNGGSKGVESAITNKGESYVLPAIYELPEYLLTVPQGKEFAGWEVDGQTKKTGESIQINKNTLVKAIWKAKPVEPSKPDAPAVDRGDYLILEKVEPTEPKVDWEIGRHYKYLYGYPDGSVHPEGQITRAEAAGLIARLAELDLSNKAKPNFKDTPSRWYNSAINIMVEKNLMFADKNGNFRPNEPITRGEFARALYYIDKKNSVVAPFADVKGHEFEAAINQAYGNGRIAGYPDGSFRPDAYIQRAEVARMLNQYADRSVSLEGMAGVKKDVIRFTDINESHWAYYEVMEAANTHDYRRAKGTLPETWVRIIQKDDRVAR